jgi:hypothetical protein
MDAGTMMLIGTGIQAGAGVGKGMAAQNAGNYNAGMLERAAADERASAQRQAQERRRQTDLVISKQVAGAAASGAGFGPSLLDIIGDTAQRGEYMAQSEMYSGEARARNLIDRSKIARYEGDQAFTGSILEGLGTAAMGYGRYNSLYGTGKTTPIGPWRTTVNYG